jgi:hypothetical protein
MRAVVACVASACDGIPEDVKHLFDAWRTTPGDYQSLARGIVTLLRDPSLREKIARRGPQTFERRFSANARLYISRCMELGTSCQIAPRSDNCVRRRNFIGIYLRRCFNHFLADIISDLHAGGISQDQVVPFDWLRTGSCIHGNASAIAGGIQQCVGCHNRFCNVILSCVKPKDAIGFRDRVLAFDVGEFAAIAVFAQALRPTMQEVEDAEFETIEPKAVVNTGMAKPTA